MEIISREFSSRVTARYSGWPVSSIEPPSVISKRISQRRFGALELVFASRSLWLSIEKSRSSIYEIMCMAAKWAVNVPIRIEPILIKLNRSLPNLDKDRQDIAHLAHMVQKGKAILELQYEKGKGISQVYLFRQSQSRPSCGFIKIPWMCTRLWPVPMTQRLQTDGDAGTSSSLRLVTSSQSRDQSGSMAPKADALALSSLHLAEIIPELSAPGSSIEAHLQDFVLLKNARYPERRALLRLNPQRQGTADSPHILWGHGRRPVIKTAIKATRAISQAIEDGDQNFAVSKGEAFVSPQCSRSSNMIFLENGAVNQGGNNAGRTQNQAGLSHSITDELSSPGVQLSRKNLIIEGSLREPDTGIKASDLDSLNLNRISDRVCAIIERKLKVERERRGIFG